MGFQAEVNKARASQDRARVKSGSSLPCLLLLLHKEAIVPVQLEDLAQALLRSGHAFLRALSCGNSHKKRRHQKSQIKTITNVNLAFHNGDWQQVLLSHCRAQRPRRPQQADMHACTFTQTFGGLVADWWWVRCRPLGGVKRRRQ